MKKIFLTLSMFFCGFLGGTAIAPSMADISWASGDNVSEFSESLATSDTPSVTISLNNSGYYPGDNMKVTLTTSAGTGDNAWDIYVGLIMPDNSLQFMTFEPSFSLNPDPVPARPSKPITTESMTILDITLPEGLPTGNCKWASALGKNNFNKISDISWAPFTLNAPQVETHDLTGRWNVQEVTTGNCPGEGYPSTDHYTAECVQDGNHLTITTPSNNTSFTGTITNNFITLVGTRPAGGGTTLINFSGTVSSDSNTVTGTGTWIWSNGSASCSGNAVITMMRASGIYSH